MFTRSFNDRISLLFIRNAFMQRHAMLTHILTRIRCLINVYVLTYMCVTTFSPSTPSICGIYSFRASWNETAMKLKEKLNKYINTYQLLLTTVMKCSIFMKVYVPWKTIFHHSGMVKTPKKWCTKYSSGDAFDDWPNVLFQPIFRLLFNKDFLVNAILLFLIDKAVITVH